MLGDGRLWLLAETGLAQGMAEVRTRMFDSSAVKGSVAPSDVLFAACYALTINYELTNEETWWLLNHADKEDLVQSVTQAVLLDSPTSWSYDDWAHASLYANGLKPSDIPAHRIRHVLDVLVKTGRTVEPDKCVDSCIAAQKVSFWRGLAASNSDLLKPE